jgi:hypothetical protein
LDIVLFEMFDDFDSGAVGFEHVEIRVRRDSWNASGFGLVEEFLAIGGVAFFAHVHVFEIVIGNESGAGTDGVEAFGETAGGERLDFFWGAHAD